MSLAEELAEEFEHWYRNLAGESGQAPRSFSGVKKSGKQFVVVLNNIPWTRAEHIQRRVFLNWLCLHEELIAYAYATMVGLEDGSRAIDIVAEDAGILVEMTLPIVTYKNDKFGYGEARVHRSKSSEEEWRPYIGLLAPTAVEEGDKDPADEKVFIEIWETAKKDGIWRQRRL